MTQNYNPKEIKRASKLVNEQEALRQDRFKQLAKPGGVARQGDYDFSGDEEFYRNQEQGNQRDLQDFKNVDIATDQTRKSLNFLYPYTYDLPDREYWETRAKYTNEKGQALYVDEDPKAVMGQTFVGPEYYDYVRRLQERQEALAFQTWIINQLDFSNPVKKDYVRRRYPQLFEFMVRGEEKKMRDKFTKEMILLKGPRSIEEFRYIYNNVVKSDLYTPPLLSIDALNIQTDYPPALPAPVVNNRLYSTNAQRKAAGNIVNERI